MKINNFPISRFGFVVTLGLVSNVTAQDSMAELLQAFSNKLAEDAVTLESSHDDSAYDDYFDFGNYTVEATLANFLV